MARFTKAKVDSERYADWIVGNKEKKGTPDFEEVYKAFTRSLAERKKLQSGYDKKSAECAEYAEEAATEWAYRIIRRTCFESENTLFNKSKEFKCALDAGEAKIARAARDIYWRCNK